VPNPINPHPANAFPLPPSYPSQRAKAAAALHHCQTPEVCCSVAHLMKRRKRRVRTPNTTPITKPTAHNTHRATAKLVWQIGGSTGCEEGERRTSHVYRQQKRSRSGSSRSSSSRMHKAWTTYYRNTTRSCGTIHMSLQNFQPCELPNVNFTGLAPPVTHSVPAGPLPGRPGPQWC